MADITVVNAANKGQSWTFKSSKKRTVEQILNTIGDGILTDPDNDLMLKEDILEVAGTYTWTPKETVTLSEETIAGLSLMAEEALAKKRSIVLSDVSMTTKNELMGLMGLPETTAVWPNKPDLLQSIKGYSWLESSEDSDENIAAYMAYLKNLLKLPDDYDLGDVKPKTKLLYVSLPMESSESRTVKGTTDVTITRSAELLGDTVRNNIQVLLELKKVDDTNKDHTPQAVCELIAAACLNRSHPVVAVLTDLNERWTFFWLAKREDDSKMALHRLPLNEGSKSVAEAKYLLESLYDDSAPRDNLPTTFADRQSYEAFQQSLVQNKRQRRGFDRDDGHSPDQDTKLSSSDGADRHSNPGTGGGFSSTSRGRGNQTDQGTSGGSGEVPMNMASTLSLFAPPAYRDVANELDLLDFVDVDEQYEIIRSFAEKYIVPNMRTVE